MKNGSGKSAAGGACATCTATGLPSLSACGCVYLLPSPLRRRRSSEQNGAFSVPARHLHWGDVEVGLAGGLELVMRFDSVGRLPLSLGIAPSLQAFRLCA